MTINRNIVLLQWYNFFYDFRPYEVIAVLYYAQVTGSFALGMAVFAVASIATAVFELPTGVLSDRIGRKPTVVVASLSSIVAISLYAFGGSFVWLALGAVFNGFTRALVSGNNDALLYDTLATVHRTDEFAEKLGKAKSMFEIGLAVSALFASALALVSLQAVMVASIVPQVVCAFIALRFVEPKMRTEAIPENAFAHIREAWLAFATNAKLRSLSLASILDYAIEETYFQFKPVFVATLWPTWALGISRALDNAAGFLGFHFAGKIIQRFSALRSLLGGQIIGRVATFVAAGIPSIASPLLLNINSFLFGVQETASGSLMHREFTDKQRATMSSLNSLASSILYAAATIGVGLLADKLGAAQVILVLGVLALPVVLLYGNLVRNERL